MAPGRQTGGKVQKSKIATTKTTISPTSDRLVASPRRGKKDRKGTRGRGMFHLCAGIWARAGVEGTIITITPGWHLASISQRGGRFCSMALRSDRLSQTILSGSSHLCSMACSSSSLRCFIGYLVYSCANSSKSTLPSPDLSACCNTERPGLPCHGQARQQSTAWLRTALKTPNGAGSG
jgi:hypothetical protein